MIKQRKLSNYIITKIILKESLIFVKGFLMLFVGISFVDNLILETIIEILGCLEIGIGGVLLFRDAKKKILLYEYGLVTTGTISSGYNWSEKTRGKRLNPGSQNAEDDKVRITFLTNDNKTGSILYQRDKLKYISDTHKLKLIYYPKDRYNAELLLSVNKKILRLIDSEYDENQIII